MSDTNDSSSRYVLTLVGLTLGILIILSAMPLSRLTDNALKDFNLFEDLFPGEQAPSAVAPSSIVDPELEALMSQADEPQAVDNNAGGDPAPAIADSASADTVLVVMAEEAPMVDGTAAIENYGAGPVLPRFRQALESAGGRTVRVAVIGDSYIEGDIFCANLRDILQQRYGGAGVGFIASHSDFPGFRQTVGMKSDGWKMHDIRTMSKRDSIRTLSSDYGVAAASASTTYNARSKYPGTAAWQRTRFVFIAPNPGTVSITDSNGEATVVEIAASPDPQCVEVGGATTSADIKVDAPGLISLGTYLDGAAGVQVDCMSIRGNSGLGTARINAGLCQKMRQWADYDLIIVEFGMNVLSAEQTDYTPYMTNMVKSVKHLRDCYPDADILIMGVGDRGVKVNGEIESMHTIAAMTKAQRETAHRTGSCFWDTRAAMGGDRASVDWRRRKLMNADYIHLNHAGGAELAILFDKALQHAINE